MWFSKTIVRYPLYLNLRTFQMNSSKTTLMLLMMRWSFMMTLMRDTINHLSCMETIRDGQINSTLPSSVISNKISMKKCKLRTSCRMGAVQEALINMITVLVAVLVREMMTLIMRETQLFANQCIKLVLKMTYHTMRLINLETMIWRDRMRTT
jgi:hypothetical protein